ERSAYHRTTPWVCETPAAPGPVVAVARHQESILFARLGATVSLRSCSHGQARSGQDWRGAGNVGQWCETSIDWAPPGWLAAIRSRSPARSSQGPCYAHSRRWRFGAPLIEWARGTRTEVRPASQIGRFRSRRRDEVATSGLPAGERAQARAQ